MSKSTHDTLPLVLAKFHSGKPYAIIAAETGLSHRTICRLLKKQNLTDAGRVKIPKEHKYQSELGKKYNFLTVTGFEYDKVKTWWFLQVKCECGRTGRELARKLKNGQRKTCGYKGCQYHSEVVKDNGKRSNFTGYKDILGSKWASWRCGALRRGLSFEITIEKAWEKLVEQNFRCALTGLDLSFNSCYSKIDGCASIDRIDSRKHYTLDNIQWVHKDVNRMKSNFTEEKLYKLAKLYCETYENKSLASCPNS